MPMSVKNSLTPTLVSSDILVNLRKVNLIKSGSLIALYRCVKINPYTYIKTKLFDRPDIHITRLFFTHGQILIVRIGNLTFKIDFTFLDITLHSFKNLNEYIDQIKFQKYHRLPGEVRGWPYRKKSRIVQRGN